MTKKRTSTKSAKTRATKVRRSANAKTQKMRSSTDDVGYDVLVLGASAGGQPAALAVLGQLPSTFDVPIIVMQHLAPGSAAIKVYAKRVPFPVQWADAGSRLESRKILFCPPRSIVELLPDGSLQISPSDGAVDKPIDRLLRSVARSFGHRAIGVVLSGMGDDGARGARELHLAGGRVVVQTMASAQHPEMPRAVVDAGGADLVVALPDIAQVLTEIVAGTSRPKPRSELVAIQRVFGEAGEVAARARAIDWSQTPLGPVIGWSEQLRDLVRMVVESPQPQQLLWGERRLTFFNDAAIPSYGARWSNALGRPFSETFPEAPDADAIHARVLGGERIRDPQQHFVYERAGRLRDGWFDVAHTPVYDADGTVVAAYNTWLERTNEVLAARRLEVLNRLSSTRAAGNRREALANALAVVKESADIPFAIAYLIDGSRKQASLIGATGVDEGGAIAPRWLSTQSDTNAWPLKQLLERNEVVTVDDLAARFGDQASTPDDASPEAALVHPLRDEAENGVAGAVVLGTSPRVLFDEPYRHFLALVGETISSKVAEAHARERERERVERLAELDRDKTEFFANVSHEFRTPLTLLLTPLEEMLQRRDELPATFAGELDAAARNSRRLLRLVDNLLDFSEIETRRQRAVLERTNLSELTEDVASAFRSAIERAGLRFDVRCDPKLPPVPVNREMWEKIVSNLLSNALKFTFDGGISVHLRALSLHAELEVADSGVGIPSKELPNIFKRFHRVHGAKARTVEGSGMGLAIVHDLVSRMGGQLKVRSTEGKGTTFTIWMPFKTVRQVLDESAVRAVGAAKQRTASDLASEAAAWISREQADTTTALEDPLGLPDRQRLRTLAPGARVLIADDNADMRHYLRRLLGAYWQVSAAADGAKALTAARELKPDLVLADVMMPRVDGFELLRAIRADDALKHTPVIFLTARAGEDTAIEGLLAGADDYLAKPFSARELTARVGGQIELSRTRRRAEELNAFLVRFSDAVRGLGDPVEVARTACRMIHEELGVERAYWAEADRATREFVITGACHTRGAAVVAGRFNMDEWGPLSSPNRERLCHAVDDTQTDPHIPAVMKARYAAMSVGAELGSPVFVDGELRSVLVANQRRPRRWTPEEIALVDSVAVRCWGEVERARAESTLRESEERKAFLLRLSDAMRPLADSRAIQGAAARLLRQELDAGWCYYLEYDEDGRVGVVLQDAAREGLPSYIGRHDVTDPARDEFLAQLAKREVAHVDDFATDPMWSAEIRARFAAFGLRSMLVAPLVKDGRPVAALIVGDTVVRQWPERAVALIQETAERTWAAVERSKAEAVLRDSEERQAFLLKLSDALRPLEDPAAIQGAATRLLRQRFDVGWCYYADFDEAGQVATVLEDATREGLPSLTGRHDVSDAPEFVAFLRTGQLFATPDLATYPLFSQRIAQGYSALGVHALLGVPVVKDSGALSLLLMADTTAHPWPQEAVDLIGEVAERTWAAVKRARAEAALRASEEKYRSLFETIDEGFGIVELMRDASGNVVDGVYRELNSSFERNSGLGDVVGRRVLELNPHLDRSWFQKNQRVADTGVAIREEHYDHGLGRWYSVHRSRIGGAGSNLIANVFLDITERKQREQRQTFLLHLSDALRPLGDAEEIRLTAAQVLGRHLGANRVAYAEDVGDGERYEVTRNYVDGVSEIVGRFRYRDYGPDIFSMLQAGHDRIQPDVANDERLSAAEKRALAEAGVGASLNVPLVKGGRLIGFLGVNYAAAHDFSRREIELVKEVAERTWAAVERAKAEAALRRAEQSRR